MTALDGRRIMVVGASTGIGRGAATALLAQGARVAWVSRRVSELELAVAEAEADTAAVGRSVVVGCDVSDADSVRVGMAAVVEGLGGLDGLVFAAARTHLEPIEDVDVETWRALFDTNVVGASLVTAAALPALRAGWGRALFITSDSVGWPFPGLGAYVASKAALDSVVESWRREHPELSICLLTAGPTATDAASSWDSDQLGRYLQRWVDEGYVRLDLTPADPADVGRQIADVFSADPLPETIDLAPARPWD